MTDREFWLAVYQENIRRGITHADASKAATESLDHAKLNFVAPPKAAAKKTARRKTRR